MLPRLLPHLPAGKELRLLSQVRFSIPNGAAQTNAPARRYLHIENVRKRRAYRVAHQDFRRSNGFASCHSFADCVSCFGHG